MYHEDMLDDETFVKALADKLKMPEADLSNWAEERAAALNRRSQAISAEDILDIVRIATEKDFAPSGSTH